MTVVVVLHDMNVAAQCANDIVAMRDGRVVHYGSVAEVITEEGLAEFYDTPACGRDHRLSDRAVGMTG